MTNAAGITDAERHAIGMAAWGAVARRRNERWDEEELYSSTVGWWRSILDSVDKVLAGQDVVGFGPDNAIFRAAVLEHVAARKAVAMVEGVVEIPNPRIGKICDGLLVWYAPMPEGVAVGDRVRIVVTRIAAAPERKR